MMTSVALMTATAGRPFFSFRRLADEALISETISWPPPMSTTTSLMTAPCFTLTTVPRNWFRALNTCLLRVVSSSWARFRASVRRAGVIIARFGAAGRYNAAGERRFAMTTDVIEEAKKAFHRDDAKAIRGLLDRNPELKQFVNQPVGSFGSPAISSVRSREMLDVLLDAGADIDAKSNWWAGGFGLLHQAAPELAMYAIQRGARVDVHAAARLGLFEKLRELVAADPALVHARGGDGQ